MKKTYITPALDVVTVNTTATMLTGSTLDPDSPSVTVKDEEWHDAFGTKDEGDFDDVWD